MSRIPRNHVRINMSIKMREYRIWTLKSGGKKPCVRNTINVAFVEMQIVDDTYRSDIWKSAYIRKVLKWQKKRAPKSCVAVVIFQSLSW